MELLPYQSDFQNDCLKLFDSNQAPYFTKEERKDYIQFLNSLTKTSPYFIVQDGQSIVAAGGFALDKDDIIKFTWGMVDRSKHGNGYGQYLADQRLKRIKEHYPDKSISLDTSQYTVGFYKRCGFRPISKELDGYGPELHKIDMNYAPIEPIVDFDTKIPLIGSELELVPMNEADFDVIYFVAQDPDIWAQHPATNRYQKDIFRAFFDSGVASGMAYIIKHKTQNRIIGSSRYNQPDQHNSSVEIGWTFLAVDCWGGTINSELKDIMLRHAFNHFNKVLFSIGPDNQRSIQAVKKLGAKQDFSITDPDRAKSIWFALTPTTYVGCSGYGQG